MSFSDRPGLTGWQRLGCAAYVVVSGWIVSGLMLNAALGDCASENECITETTRALMFYGSPVLALIGGVLLTKFMMRDRD